jgi:regulator of sigma D
MKKNILNEIMGVPKSIDPWIDSLKNIIIQIVKDEESNAQKQIMQLAEGMQQMQQALQQTQQFMQQVAKESDSNDEKIFQVIEQITSALEKINDKTLQIEKKHDKMVEEQKEEAKIEKIKSQSYNEGYKDAEGGAEDEELSDVSFGGLSDQEGLDGQLPDDILEGLEGMSDEALELLKQQNPEILELIK